MKATIVLLSQRHDHIDHIDLNIPSQKQLQFRRLYSVLSLHSSNRYSLTFHHIFNSRYPLPGELYVVDERYVGIEFLCGDKSVDEGKISA